MKKQRIVLSGVVILVILLTIYSPFTYKSNDKFGKQYDDMPAGYSFIWNKPVKKNFPFVIAEGAVNNHRPCRWH